MVQLPSHHVARLDHRIEKRGIIASLDHHVSNLPAHPTILTFEKRRGSDSLRVLTGKRGRVKHKKGKFFEGILGA